MSRSPFEANLTSLSITGECIVVTVGKEIHRQDFFLHERLFTSHSEFLKRATITRQNRKSAIILPEYNSWTFQLYVVLTYTGSLATRDLPEEWQSLVNLYILADRLEDKWAKNRVVDAMHSFVREHIPRAVGLTDEGSQTKDHISVASLVSLYAGTPTGSPARRLVVELFADNGTEGWLVRAGALLPREFLFDVTHRLLQKRPSVVFGNMLDRPSSHYHEMLEGEMPDKDCESMTKRTKSSEAAGEKSAFTGGLFGKAPTPPLFNFSNGAEAKT